MKKIIIAFITGIVVTLGVSAQNAADILDRAARAYESSDGIKAAFSMNTRSTQQKINESFEGAIQIKGAKFKYETPDMIVWFDGKTQWTYLTRSEEVNVTTPSGDELQQTNPLLILKSYKGNYEVSLKGQSTSATGKATYDVVLVPKKAKDIEKIELQIEKNNNLPTGIIINAKRDIRTAIRISKLQTSVNQPDATFVFNAKDYPEAEIIDLR